MAKPWRQLSDAELESYDLIPRSLAQKVRVIDVPFVPGGYAGITLGRFVFLSRPIPSDGTSVLMAHELVHVAQFARVGLAHYIYAYLKSFLADLYRMRNWNQAYRAIPAEVEAREVTNDWHRRRVQR